MPRGDIAQTAARACTDDEIEIMHAHTHTHAYTRIHPLSSPPTHLTPGLVGLSAQCAQTKDSQDERSINLLYLLCIPTHGAEERDNTCDRCVHAFSTLSLILAFDLFLSLIHI